MVITLNAYNLDTTINRVSVAYHDSSPDGQTNALEIARRDKAKFVSFNYGLKKITVEGIITGTDRDNLETNLDTFKKNVFVSEINLVIAYAGSTRTYVVTPSAIKITRSGFHNTFVPFSIDLIAYDPAGKSPTVVSESWTNLRGCYTAVFTAEGSMPPELTYTIDVHSADGFSQMEILNMYKGDAITIDGLFSADDVIIVNSENLSVKRNGIEKEYSGVFPQAKVDINTVKLRNISTTKHDVDLTISHTPRWL